MVNQRYPRPPVKGPVVIPSCAQVKLIWENSGQQFTNVHHGTVAAGPLNPTIAETLMQALLSSAGFTAFLPHLGPAVFFNGVHVKDLRQPYLPTYENSTTTHVPGTSAGAPTSAATSLVVTLHTAQSGKGFFGRSYLGGITQDNMADARHWGPGIRTPAEQFIAAVHSAMQSAGISWGVAQRALQANTTPGAPPNLAVARAASVIPGTSATLTDFRIDTQRKRLGRA